MKEKRELAKIGRLSAQVEDIKEALDEDSQSFPQLDEGDCVM